jgi:hypothetical protein
MDPHWCFNADLDPDLASHINADPDPDSDLALHWMLNFYISFFSSSIKIETVPTFWMSAYGFHNFWLSFVKKI